MTTFLKLIAAEPDIARVPVMVDSSKWEVIEAGLKCVSGKPIVNSISMKEGEEAFLARPQGPRLRRRDGSHGLRRDRPGRYQSAQGRDLRRAYKLLVANGVPPEDMIFDPNIFAVATGMEEHDRYALDFIEAREIRERCPHVHFCGGLSNLSFSFRGNEPVRRAMHSIFLYHAIPAGWTWGSSTPASSTSTTPSTRCCARRARTSSSTARPDATERLVTLAEK